jgi:hypothetical protein
MPRQELTSILHAILASHPDDSDSEETTMSHEATPSQGAEARPSPLAPTPIQVPDDLQLRLASTRWPVDAGDGDWCFGVIGVYLQQLIDLLARRRPARGRGCDQCLAARRRPGRGHDLNPRWGSSR